MSRRDFSACSISAQYRPIVCVSVGGEDGGGSQAEGKTVPDAGATAVHDDSKAFEGRHSALINTGSNRNKCRTKKDTEFYKNNAKVAIFA